MAGGHLASLVFRILAAVLGGYVLAHTLSVALAAAWPLSRADAALVALQGSFVVHVGVVLWAFSARSALRAWLGVLLLAAFTSLAAWCWV